VPGEPVPTPRREPLLHATIRGNTGMTTTAIALSLAAYTVAEMLTLPRV
jgi:hypothetical protein